MKVTEIHVDDPVVMVRTIREKRYEETRNMTHEERNEYRQRKLEEFERLRKQVNHTEYNFPFLVHTNYSRKN